MKQCLVLDLVPTPIRLGQQGFCQELIKRRGDEAMDYQE